MSDLLGPPYVDVRVEVLEITIGEIRREFPTSLHSVNLHPPASGPEIELVFGTPVGGEAAAEGVVRTAVERSLGCAVLAIRTRTEDPEGEIDPSLLRSWASRIERLGRAA